MVFGKWTRTDKANDNCNNCGGLGATSDTRMTDSEDPLAFVESRHCDSRDHEKPKGPPA